MKKGQSGNAIILVLMGIILFGALAYTFMKSAKTGEGNLTKHQARLQAQAIISFSTTIERSISRLLLNGCSENQISFVGSNLYPPSLANYNNGNSPVDQSCHVFNPSGGKVTDVDLRDAMVPLANRILGQNMYLATNAVHNVGTVKPDLIMMIPDLRLEVCNSINDIIGITAGMAVDNLNSPTFGGNFPLTATTIIGDDGVNPATIQGRTSFCMQHAYPFYQYIKVLIER